MTSQLTTDLRRPLTSDNYHSQLTTGQLTTDLRQLTTDLRQLTTDSDYDYTTTTMPINPVPFAHSVCDEFLRYIFSEFPLSDPQMESQAKELLQRPSSLDIPLVKGPYVSLSEAFAKGDSIQQMAVCGKLHQ
jgi:hypothetical protein